LEVSDKPLELLAHQCKPATVLGDNKKEYPLSNLAKERDFSHHFTGPLKSDQINNWAIFYSNYGK